MTLRFPESTNITFFQAYPGLAITRAIPLLIWTFLYYGLKIRREWKIQEQRTAQANSLAQNAQLQMLRYQLNPHFLFNSMNSIRALIDEDEAKAREMITELSEFLRYSLVSNHYSNVPLKIEMEAIRHYFSIQKKRYEDKLKVFYDIEPRAGEYPVLSFLVHPLVENAVKYGMQASLLPLTVRVKATVSNDVLTVDIINSGKWIKSSSQDERTTDGTGTGLDNVRLRLENAYPGRHRFDIFEKEGHVHVQLKIGTQSGDADEKNL
jgi:LytS/YehU family sensor histidine kinase